MIAAAKLEFDRSTEDYSADPRAMQPPESASREVSKNNSRHQSGWTTLSAIDELNHVERERADKKAAPSRRTSVQELPVTSSMIESPTIVSLCHPGRNSHRSLSTLHGIFEAMTCWR